MKWGVWAVPAFAALLLAAVAACGEAGDPAESSRGYGFADEGAASGQAAPTAAPAATAAPAPTAAAVAQEADGGGGGKVRPAPLAQNRIIVHTARMSLVVDDVAHTVDGIANVASGLGGWVVNSDRSSRHSGSISVRVPAQSLDEAFLQVEALALEVESRAVTSEDVTDEYVDSQSRLVSLRATEERLLSFLDRAGKVEDALLVQKEISELQQQIETIQGRLNFLEQTAAFSLLEVSLKLTSATITVDAGGDVSVRVGQAARFRASFRAPRDVDEVSFVWDFGDGNSARGDGSILRPDGTRITATVNHTYTDDRDSPYIVSVHLTAAGEGGIGDGSDSLEVAVSHVPTIEVFAGEDRTVEEGDKQDYSASFLRHAELWGLRVPMGLWRRVAHGDRRAGGGDRPCGDEPHLLRSPARGLHGGPHGQRHERCGPGVGLRFRLGAGHRVAGLLGLGVELRRDGQGRGAGVVGDRLGGDQDHHLGRHPQPGDHCGRRGYLPLEPLWPKDEPPSLSPLASATAAGPDGGRTSRHGRGFRHCTRGVSRDRGASRSGRGTACYRREASHARGRATGSGWRTTSEVRRQAGGAQSL